MAIMDAKLEFSDAQDISASSGSNNDSTNVINLGSGANWMGTSVEPAIGDKLQLQMNVATTFAGASAVLTVTLITDDNASFNSGKTLRTFRTWKVGTDTLSAGTLLIDEDISAKDMEQYVKLNYAVSGANLTTAAVDAFLTWGAVPDIAV